MLKRTLILLTAVAALTACSGGNQPYVGMRGGGFIFNYRLAVAFAGVTLAVGRPLPEGASVEVTMANPAGGPPIVMRQSPAASDKQIDFLTGDLTGIVAKKDYPVVIRVLAKDGSELQKIEKTFRSDVDESVLPSAPLTVGPGYAKNPAAPENP